jgi:hypothetical protein
VRKVQSSLMVLAVVAVTGAQSTEPPISDTRLTVHTLVREDIFAGFLDNNMDRFARGERNIELLLKERPTEKANLVAWRGGADLYRAVVAHESGKREEFTRQLQQARDDFAEAAKLATGNDGVAAITGGTLVNLADRLPEEHRAAAWAQAYDAYSVLWKAQGAAIDKFPVHFRGELLAGMAQSAQRTGRAEEADQFVDRLLAMSGTPYEKLAKEWKANPASASTTNLTCKTCHNAGRLSAKLAAVAAVK